MAAFCYRVSKLEELLASAIVKAVKREDLKANLPVSVIEKYNKDAVIKLYFDSEDLDLNALPKGSFKLIFNSDFGGFKTIVRKSDNNTNLLSIWRNSEIEYLLMRKFFPGKLLTQKTFDRNQFDCIREYFVEEFSAYYSEIMSALGDAYINLVNLSGSNKRKYTVCTMFDFFLGKGRISLCKFPILFEKQQGDGSDKVALVGRNPGKIINLKGQGTMNTSEDYSNEIGVLREMANTNSGSSFKYRNYDIDNPHSICRIDPNLPRAEHNIYAKNYLALNLSALAEAYKTFSLIEVTNECPTRPDGGSLFSGQPGPTGIPQDIADGVEAGNVEPCRMYIPSSLLAEGGFSTIGRSDPIYDVEYWWWIEPTEVSRAQALLQVLTLDDKRKHPITPIDSGSFDRKIDGREFRFRPFVFFPKTTRQFTIWYASRLKQSLEKNPAGRSRYPKRIPRQAFSKFLSSDAKAQLSDFGSLGRKKVKGKLNPSPRSSEGTEPSGSRISKPTGVRPGYPVSGRESNLGGIVRTSVGADVGMLPPALRSATDLVRAAREAAKKSGLSPAVLAQYLQDTSPPYAKIDPENFDFPPQEWCHLLAHGDGGSDRLENLSAGSAHSNTEECAIEDAMRKSGQKASLRLKITAYMLPFAPTKRPRPSEHANAAAGLIKHIVRSSWFEPKQPAAAGGNMIPERNRDLVVRRELRQWLLAGQDVAGLPAPDTMIPQIVEEIASYSNIDISDPEKSREIARKIKFIRGKIGIKNNDKVDDNEYNFGAYFPELKNKDYKNIYYGLRRLYESTDRGIFSEIPVSLFHKYKLYISYKNDVSNKKRLIFEYLVDSQREIFDRNNFNLLFYMVLTRITDELPDEAKTDVGGDPIARAQSRVKGQQAPPPAILLKRSHR